jgi:hypothetical protein
MASAYSAVMNLALVIVVFLPCCRAAYVRSASGYKSPCAERLQATIRRKNHSLPAAFSTRRRVPSPTGDCARQAGHRRWMMATPMPTDGEMPRNIKPSAVDLLEDEFAQERASALGRLGRALEAALAALARFDAEQRRETSPAQDRQARASLVAEASVALWHFIVQREACGLRDTRHVLRDYRVPPEVAARMGAQTAPPAKPASVSRTKTR